MICSKPLIHLLLEQIIPIELEINSDPKKNIAGLFSRCTTPKVTTAVSQSRSGQVEFGGIEEQFEKVILGLLLPNIVMYDDSAHQIHAIWSCMVLSMEVSLSLKVIPIINVGMKPHPP